ncbi:MAG: c-type cytochrome [Planctomycetota bacterium]
MILGPMLTFGVMGLLGCADEDRLKQCMKHQDPSVRLAATLVLRRRGDPRLAQMLDDPSPKIVRAAASAISDLPVPESMPALAESFDRILRAKRQGGVHAGPTIRRMINANFRLGEAAGLERLLQAVSAPGISEEMRLEAFAAVSDWVQPSVRDRVIGDVRPIEPPVRDLLVHQAALQKYLPGLLESVPDMSGEIRTLANAYGVRFSDEVNLATLKDRGAPTSWRVLAFGQLVESDDTKVRDNAIALALDDRNRLLRAAAQPAVLARDAAEGQKLMTKSFRKGAIDVRQHTTAQLAELDSEWSEALLLEGLQAYGNGLPRALEIDVLEAARTRDTDALYEAVEAIESNWDTDDPLDGWRGCMDGGDADRGRTLFISHWAAQCQRCHAIGGDGGEAGPNLQDVGERMSSEKLLESIIHPQGEVAEGYGPVSSMPEMKPLLTPLEVRDLVAYLSTLR